MRILAAAILTLFVATIAVSARADGPHAHHYTVEHSDAEWRKILTGDQYDILRQKGTEPPFSSPFHNLHDKVVFVCAGCGAELFSTEKKFDSGTGWPSFWAPIRDGAVETESDHSYGMERVEVKCARCGGHLGHVFPDGPKPTGLRYCINGVALKKK